MAEYIFNDSIVNILRSRLKSSFPLYNPDSLVNVLTIKDNIHIGCHETNESERRFLENGFDLQVDIRKGLCYILHFSVSKDKRRQKNGTHLYSVIESFCVDNLGCRNFITSASGESARDFWESMGFYYLDKKRFEALKLII